MKVLFSALLLLTSLTVVQAQTYSEFVADKLQELHTDIYTDIEEVNSSTAPKDVKLLRKKIGLYKIYLDLGIYLYPYSDWEEIRAEYDEAYEVYGNFKDLYDTQEFGNGSSEERKRRKKVLKWNKRFFEYEEEWQETLSSPLRHGSYDIKKKNLPKFLWRQLKYTPEAQDDMEDVLFTLTDELFEEGHDQLADLIDMKTLLDYENEEAFHDFRKLVRTALKLIAELPSVDEQANEYSVDVLLKTISHMGDINDKLVAYHYYGGKTLKKSIKEAWTKFRDWASHHDVQDHLKDVL